jgi:Holliday junction resolvase RusA-like endonuclease
MPKINVSVRGQRPLPYANNEWEWRRLVATCARKYRERVQDVHFSRATNFTVSVIFYFKGDRIPRADLDNLAKPVLDTLFRVDNSQVQDRTLTGALFNIDDRGVCKLVLEKRRVLAFTDQAADITVWWDEDAKPSSGANTTS